MTTSGAGPVVVPGEPLAASGTWPRVAGGPRVDAGGVVVGEWSLTRAAFTDCHQHIEVNTLIEGELFVSVDGQDPIRLGPGDTIAVPAGSRGCYAAPEYARMHYVYGPGERGMDDVDYEEL